MNKAFFSNFKRFIATLLVIITLMGMLPLTASASAKGNTHSKSINQSIKTTSGSGGGYEDDTYNYDQGRFTRFTLVRFPFSDETPNNKSVSEWASGTVVGSVDILTDGVVPAGTKYFKVKGSNLLSNAFSYRNGKETEIVDGYSFEPLFGELPAYPTSNLYEPLRYSDGDGDPMMYRFGSINGAIPNPDTDQWCINSTFNKVIKLIVDRTSNSDARTELTADYDANTFTIWDTGSKQPVLASTVSEDFRYAYNFVASAANNGSCYRLLVEPGVITQLPYGTDEGHESMAATLRDIASVLLIQENEITCGNAANGYGTANGEYEGEMVYICNQTKNNWVGSNSVLGMWSWRNVQQYWFVFRSFFRLQRQALGLYNTDNTFRTYTVQKDADGNVTNVLFNQTPDGQAFFGHVSNEMADAFFEVWSYEIEDYQCRKYSSYAIAQYVLDIWKRGEGMMGWVGRGRAGCLNSPAFNEGTYPALGLGVIEPGSIVGSITVTTDEITVKKVVAGDKAADLKAFRSTYEFEVSIPASTYDTLVTAGVTFSDKDSGTPINFTEDGGNRIYAFTLTDGAQKTIKLDNIPESISGTVNDWFNATITEKDVDDLYEHFKDEDPGFALHFNNSAAKCNDGVIKDVKLGSTIIFKNQLGDTPPQGEGTLHVIVDYNIPGAAATSDPADPMNANCLDCGIHPAGEIVDLALTVKGTALNPGTTIQVAPKCNFKFKGLSVDPGSVMSQNSSNNGKITGCEGNVYHYQLPTDVGDKDELLILYVIWDIDIEGDIDIDIDTDSDGDGDGDSDSDTNVYTVYWDLGAGFDGGGITSQTCGQIVIPALNLTATASCGCGTGTARAQRNKIKIDFGFDPPDIPHNNSAYRIGCWFVGWLPDDPSYDPHNYHAYFGNGAGAGFITDIYTINGGAAIGGKMMLNGEDWLPYIKDNPDPPGRSMTYHAVWVGNQYSFDANGGYYENKSDSKYAFIPENSTEGTYILKGLPDYDDSWFGDFYHHDKTIRSHRLKCATVRQAVQNHSAYWVPRIEPVRTGYTFTGWYWDPQCSVPVTRNEEGFIPGRIYFAGWDAEPVYVRYHDTREGNSVVTTQIYKYDDMISLSKNMASTIGWTFSGWAEEGSSTRYTDGTYLDVFSTICHDNLYPDGNGGGNMSGNPGILEDMSGEGQGVISGKHYWTLDLYSLWNQETADYVATFHFNDYNNNDGARPTELTVGIVDSITNREVATTKVVVDPDKEVFTKTVATGLAMTNNNASTERVKYYMYLKDYTDIDGQTFTIQNTSASTGEIALASVSNADTSPMASYRYTINQVNTGNVTDQPNIDGGNDGLYTGVMYFDHNLMTTGDDVEFTIRWNDQSDNDGMRPETLKLTLMGRTNGGAWKPVQDWVSPGNGMLHQSNSGVVYINSGICDVSDDGNVWTYIFKDFQKYDSGDYIEYAVKVEGYQEYAYTASTTGYVEDGIVLSYEPVKAPVPVDIYWHDNTNQDGMRPDSVVVQLIAHQWNRDLGAYESVVVNAKRFTGFSSTSNLWSSSFDNMPVYHDGQPILYHLVVASDLNGNMDDDSNPYTWSEGTSGSPYKDGARPSVDIYHNADERSVTATVQWDDMLNNDGKRPDSITLQLYANNEPVPGDEYCVVLTGDPKALTWTYTFEHLDVYTEKRTGQEIIYKVKIIDAQGGEFESYTPSYINKYGAFVETFGASGEAFVLMSYKPKTGTVSGAVYWQDDNNRDGERADFVTVALHASALDASTGEWIDYIAATKTIRSDEINTMTADEWHFEFENMPVYRGSQVITYYITITSDLNGNTNETAKLYGWGEKARGDLVADPNLEVSVTVYQGVETISVHATVEWDDDNNNDGLRPNAVQLQLYADNVRVAGEAYTVTLYGNPTEDTWTHTFEHLPRYASGASGKEINYTVYAAEIKDYDLYGMYDETGRDGTEHRFMKYEAWYPANDEGGMTNSLFESVDAYVTLIHKNNEIEVPFSIIWKDENNRDAQRPDYVTVSLMAYQWNNTLHTWEVTEKATAAVPSDELNTMTADEWTGTFGKQLMYHDGVKVIYHLSVTSDLNAYIPEGSFEYGWIESVYGNQIDVIPQVIISQNINTVVVPATVYWDDNANNDNIRPTNIVLQLYAHEPGGTPAPVAGQAYRVNLTGDPTADNWNYTFSGMPKYAEGQSGVELIYTVQAIEANGEPLYGYYIIMANGEEEEVLRYEASYLYENPETGATENTLDPTMSDRAYVRLAHTSETQTMTFSANWHDSDNVDGVRPVNVNVDLYKTVGNGEPVYLKTIVLAKNANGAWTYKMTELAGYENGLPVKYAIEIPEDVRAELEKVGYSVTTQDHIVHLYHTPATGSVSAQLYWSDEDNHDGYRVDSVMAELYKNGMPTGMTVDLNATNNWSATWTNLDVHYVANGNGGTDVEYAVKVDAPNGYSATYEPAVTTVEADETVYIRLTHENDVKDVEIEVFWMDLGDNDGYRPESITVALLADGEYTGKTATLTAEDRSWKSANIWSHVFENMPVYDGTGREIYYSVEEYDTQVWQGFYEALTTGTILYLSHDPIKSTMYVSFQWNDNNNADGMRPGGLYLQLLANGQAVDGTEYRHTVSFDKEVDGSTWTFGDLPVYSVDGVKMRYNVKVIFDPEFGGAQDYTYWTSRDVQLQTSSAALPDQVVVRLSRNSEVSERSGSIYWFDCNNLFGNRPESLTVTLRNNYNSSRVQYILNANTGEITERNTGKLVGSVSVDEWTGDSSVWHYTIEDLPLNYVDANGMADAIYYYVEAVTTSIAAYYPIVSTGESMGMDVALTHKYYENYCQAANQDYTVTVMWLDNSDAWGYRPNANGVKANLLANGRVYDTVYLTNANAVSGNENAWTYKWETLPTYQKGEAIVWSIMLNDVPAYTQEQITDTAAASAFVYRQSFGFDFAVNWDDSDNDDAVRPNRLGLNVIADGTVAGHIEMTGDGNTWYGNITDMPVYRENNADAAIQYAFHWDDATEQALAAIGYTASPTLNGIDTDSAYWYYLSASEFGDNEDAGYDELGNKYQWETTLSYDKEIADYWFSVTFEDDTDRDGLRPSSVTVDLLADGIVADTREIAINGDEAHYDIVWKDLEVYESGEPIIYTVELRTDVKGYNVSYNTLHTAVTLSHDPALVGVTAAINWDDSTQLVDVYNPNGAYVRSYEQIARADVYVQLYADGEPYGEPVLIPASIYGEGETLDRTAYAAWENLYKYRDHGTEIVYDIKAASDELDALLSDGHNLAYDFGTKYYPSATVTHDLYDVRGTVYYMYTHSDDFLLEGVPVTIYLYDDAAHTYTAIASTISAPDGSFEFLNLEQGFYIVRATYTYGENVLAGTAGLSLDRQDSEDNIVIVNREAVNDADHYQYSVTGQAFYQTDATDPSTVTPVPADSVVILYKSADGSEVPEYIGMTTTDADGRYAFGGLTSAEYFVTVVFAYEGGTYTYDNADALRDRLGFIISGADAVWPDIIKQVNRSGDPRPPHEDPEIPEEPEKKPVPCVTGGYVYYSEDSIHTSDPIEGVDVYVYAADTNAEIGKTVTDADGRWDIEGLAEGRYIAVFSYQGNDTRVLVFDISAEDYETGTYEAAPQYFDRHVETPVGTISGVVLDEDGRSMRALACVYDKNGNLQDFAYTDTMGHYEFTVPAGYDYNLRILAVEDDVTTHIAGSPYDEFTTLDYYTLSGVFGVDGELQANKLVAVYYETDSEYNLVTATLTDSNGRFTAKVYSDGNYRVCPYINGEIFETRDVTVGYQNYLPECRIETNGRYSLNGTESYSSIIVYRVDGGTVRLIHSSDAPADGYRVTNLYAGSYRIELTKADGSKVIRYATCPTGTVVDVTYYVTVSGEVVDAEGKAIIGSTVDLYDANGNRVGERTIILSDGGYSYGNLPKGEYKIVITSPHTSSVLADKWTYESDSYGTEYPNGMAADGRWILNINARVVSGKVTDPNGEPIEGAYVTFKDLNNPERRFVATTGEDGTYVIGLADGRYGLECSYYWDAKHSYPGSGISFLLVNSDENNVDFIVKRSTLEIQALRKADNLPAANTEIAVYFSDGTLFWTGTADENGAAGIKVFDGTYIIRANYDGASASIPETKIITDKTVTIYLDSSVYVTGTVTDPEGSPVPDGIVYYDDGNGHNSHVYTDDDGRYTIVIPASELGRYEIYAVAGTETGESVAVMVRSDMSVDLTVGKEQSDDGEEHSVSGIVTDEEGNRLADAIVTVTWGNDKTNKAVTSTDSDGVYEFMLPDGTYYLSAEYEAANGYSYVTNADYTVHVVGSDVERNLLVLMRYNVTVTVIDADGAPVSDATVRYTGAESGSATTGSDGAAELYLANGKYRFYAKTESRSSKTIDVTVNGETEVVITLTNTGIMYEPPTATGNGLRIWGYVYDPSGMPVEGASAELWKQDFETLEWERVDAAATDNAGYYEFDGLEEGTYRVDTVYAYDMTCDVEPDGFYIDGYLTDDYGDELSNCTVELYDETGDLIATLYPDEDGYYRFDELDPDMEYTVCVTDATEEPLLEETRYPEADHVGVSGIATDFAGHVIANTEIDIRNADGETVATTLTDEDGWFSVIVDEDSGPYTVAFEFPVSYEIETETYKRDTTDRNAPYLEASWYTIEGYVHDDDRRPVEGAAVILYDASYDKVDECATDSEGYYIFDHLKDGIYYIEIVIDGVIERVYEIDVESGRTSDLTPEPEKPEPENINVIVTDYTKSIVREPEDGWFDGYNEFTVTNDQACLVFIRDSRGELTRLRCTEDSQSDTYRFNGDLHDGDEIIIVLVGDIDLNGRINGTDATRMLQYLSATYNLNEIQELTADVDRNGRTNGTDATKLAQYLAGNYEFSWDLTA